MNNHLEAARIMMKTNGGPAKEGISLTATANNTNYIPPSDKLYNQANVNVSKTLQTEIPVIVNNKLNSARFYSIQGNTIGNDWHFIVYRESTQGPYGQIGTMTYGFGTEGFVSTFPINGNIDMVIDASSTVDNVKGQINNFYLQGKIFIELYYHGNDYGYATTTPVAIYDYWEPNNLYSNTLAVGTKRDKRDVGGYINRYDSIIGSNGSYAMSLDSKVFNSRKGSTSEPGVGGYEFTFHFNTNWFTRGFYYGNTTNDDYINTWANSARSYTNYKLGQSWYSFFNYTDTLFWTNPNYYYPTVLKRLMLHIYTLQEEGEI